MINPEQDQSPPQAEQEPNLEEMIKKLYEEIERIQKDDLVKIIQNPEALQQMVQMPVEQLLAVTEIQNAVSKMDAEQLIQQQMQAEQAAKGQAAPIDPNAVMMADIEQKKVSSELKHEDSMRKAEAQIQTQESKAEVEAFKAKLKYESEHQKLEAQREMAEEKHEVDLAIAEMKQGKGVGL